MARNFSIGEAAQIIVEGTDHEAIMDMGRRYPLLVAKMAKVAAKAGEEFSDLMSFMPEYLSANKVNSSMKKALIEEDGDAKPANKAKKEDKPAKKADKKPAKKAKVEDDEESDSQYASMKGKELNELIDKVGGRKKCVKEFGDAKNGSMVKFLEKYYPNGVDADEDDDDEWEDVDDDDIIDDDEEEEEVKPKKSAKSVKKAPAKKAPAKKAAKKSEPEDDEEEDDDDDWEI